MSITADVVAKYEAAGRGEREALAWALGMNYNTLRGAVSTAKKIVRQEVPETLDEAIPENMQVGIEPALRLETPNTWVYASDFHAPFHSRAMVQKLVNVCKAERPTTLIIGGDLLDFPSISRWPRTSKVPTVDEVCESAGKLIVYLSQFVESMVILPGNHCERLVKKLDDAFSFSRVVHAALDGRKIHCQLEVTNLDFVLMGDEGSDYRDAGWVMGHPRFYSAQATKGVGEVAAMRHRNVIGAHSHLQGIGWSRDGRYVVVDPGHMSDESMHAYHVQSAGLSKYAAWKPGFVLVRNGIPALMADGLVDWSDFT